MTCTKPSVDWSFVECETTKVYSNHSLCPKQIKEPVSHILVFPNSILFSAEFSFFAYFQDLQPNITRISRCSYTAEISFHPNKSGIFKFVARNNFGTNEVEGNVLLSELEKEFEIVGVNGPHFVGDTESVTCAAAIYKYSALDWYKNGTLISNSMRKFIYFIEFC